MTRPHLVITAKVLISLAAMGIMLHRVNLAEIGQLMRTLNPLYLVGVLGLSCVGFFISAWKWRTLLKGIETPPSFIKLLRLFWIGAFFNNFLPGRTGGDVIKAYGIAAGAKNRSGAAITVLIDRGINLIALLFIVLVALMLATSYPIDPALRAKLLWIGLLGILIGIAAMYAIPRLTISRQHRWLRLLEQAIASLQNLSQQPAELLKVSLLAIAYQTTVILSNYGVARSLNIDVPLAPFFYAIPIIALITMLPVSINGFGIREGAYALVFAPVGMAPEAAMSISLVATGAMITLSLIGGLFYVYSPFHIHPVKCSQPQTSLDATT